MYLSIDSLSRVSISHYGEYDMSVLDNSKGLKTEKHVDEPVSSSFAKHQCMFSGLVLALIT